MQHTILPLSARYRSAVHFALAQQVPWAVICMLLLDLGFMAKVCGVTMIGFWAVVASIMIRRPLAPTATDLAFVRIGFFPLFAAAYWLASLSS